jgi:hypothetical protein
VLERRFVQTAPTLERLLDPLAAAVDPGLK